MKQIVLLFLILIYVTACSKNKADDYLPEYSALPPLHQEKEYIVGIHPLHNPKRLHEIFGPVIDHISDQIEGARFKLEASRDYAAYDKKLYAGKFDFALPNPYQTINALEHNYTVFGKMADDENFRGIFLVRKDSGINSVADLKGKAVSFPAPTALAATMMPQYYLQTHGLNVMQDINIQYVGSQESSIMNVMLGNTVAAATWPPPWRLLSKERPELKKQLKVIWETKSLPNNAVVARQDVDKNLINQVKNILFNLHTHPDGKRWLKHMELSRFESANNDTYNPVIDFINKFDTTVRPIK